MTIKILFSANDENWKRYKSPLQDALDNTSLDYELGRTITPCEVDYIIYAPSSSLQDFSPYTKLKAVLNLWAGVEGVTNNKTLNVPLARMVDSGLTDGMVEWVTGHTLRHHLGIDKHIHGQDGIWRSYVPPLAKDRIITILGLGTLGTACGIALKRLGFNVRGWSRREKSVDGILCFYGDEQIDSSLMDADIVVLLLPDTPLTKCWTVDNASIRKSDQCTLPGSQILDKSCFLRSTNIRCSAISFSDETISTCRFLSSSREFPLG